MEVRFCDETEWGIGWIAAEPLQRCSHALFADGRVWLTDPVDGDGVDERVRRLGEPAGVIQLLDRHERDSEALARRLDVPLYSVPESEVPGSPFVGVPLRRRRFWKEIALWWPERRVLVAADALGTVGYFVLPHERLGLHPLWRLTPPHQLLAYEPEHVLCGHGEGILGGAAPLVRRAVETGRRRVARAWVAAIRSFRR